jgi:hypothetical protein
LPNPCLEEEEEGEEDTRFSTTFIWIAEWTRLWFLILEFHSTDMLPARALDTNVRKDDSEESLQHWVKITPHYVALLQNDTTIELHYSVSHSASVCVCTRAYPKVSGLNR